MTNGSRATRLAIAFGLGAILLSMLREPGFPVKEARCQKVLSDLLVFDAALDMYEKHNGFAPTREQGLDALWRRPPQAPVPTSYPAGGYIRRMPVDPWGKAYRYAPERVEGRVWSDDGEQQCGSFERENDPNRSALDAEKR